MDRTRFGPLLPARPASLPGAPSDHVKHLAKEFADVHAVVADYLRHREEVRAYLTPPRLMNPRTKETFVLLRVEEYERLKEEEYDDSPWTSEERHALAWEAGKHAGWEDMDEYDNVAEEP